MASKALLLGDLRILRDNFELMSRASTFMNPSSEDPALQCYIPPSLQASMPTSVAAISDSVDILAKDFEQFGNTLSSELISGSEMENEVIATVACADRMTSQLFYDMWWNQDLIRNPRVRIILRSRFQNAINETIRAIRLIILYCPEAKRILSKEVLPCVMTMPIPWWAYFRTMANLFWSAIRHPLLETTIDLSTGRVLYRV